MASVVAAASDTAGRVVLMVVVLGGASWTVRNALLAWRGREVGWIAEREVQTRLPYPSFWGSHRKYRTMLGSVYLLALGGAGFSIVAVGDLVRIASGRDEDWGPWWAASGVGVALVMAGVVLTMAFLWTGLPDSMRPPCQRGWEIVDGDLKLVRPGRTRDEYEQRKPLWAAAAGDDRWADWRFGARQADDR